MNIKPYDVGIIVGRFQVDELHTGHIELIKNLVSKHDKALICVGVTEVLGSKENPLDYPARSAMIRSAFPNVLTVPLKDHSSDETWSEHLDETIKAIFPVGRICVYGGRDSFIKHYKGRYDTYEFPNVNYRPGTEIRREIGKAVHNSPDFRKGVIYASQNVYPRTFITVDVAILRETQGKFEKTGYDILLGRKKGRKDWRFPGGFLDQQETLEQCAIRESKEETGLEIENVEYICSSPIADWRYRGTSDSIMTSFFCGMAKPGLAKANDDLEEVEFFNLNHEVRHLEVTPEHRRLLELIIEKKGKK